ncbi:MAG: S8 family serine peptidase, partial [Bdellovibrionota bacterium]
PMAGTSGIAFEHGTHVAGIAAGRFDGAQFGGHFRGGAPKATLFGIKVLGKSGGSDADILAGIALAVEKGVDIVNMSLGSSRRPTDGLDSLARAIDQVARRTNVFFVISAGNGGPGMNTIGAPTTAPRALSIGASVSGETWRTDYNIPQAIDAQFLWSFSARGPMATGEIRPTLLAPGSAYSSIPLARLAGQHSGYDVMQGTSMAAPAATGALASLLDAVRKLKGKLELASAPLDLRWALVEGAIDINTLNASKARAPKYDRFDQGAGLLNLPGAFAALEKRGLAKAIDYTLDAASLRATYTSTARGIYSTMRLPDTVTFNVRKTASDPIDPTEHNFDREFDVTSDTAWATPQNSKVVLNGLNESPVNVTIDQAALTKLPYGVHMARITGRNAGLQEWVFDITYVKARELTETFNRGEFYDPSVQLVPGDLTRYHFFVGTDRTRIKTTLRVPVLDLDGKVTDGRYRLIVSDPTGRRVLESAYATGTNPFVEFQVLNPMNGVWEVIVYRSFGAKDDPTAAILRFSTEALDIDPSVWQDTLVAGQSLVSKTFTLMSGGRTISPIGTVELSSVGTSIPDVALVNKQKSTVPFNTPKGTRHVVIRTREVKGNASADVDLTLLLDGKEIASSGGPSADEKMEVTVPGGSALTVVIDAFDLLNQPQGAIDVELDFSLPAPLTGSTTLTGQPLARGVAKKMSASLDLAGLATGVVDEVRTQFKTVVLHGEMELFDTKQQSDTKVGSVPLALTLP